MDPVAFLVVITVVVLEKQMKANLYHYHEIQNHLLMVDMQSELYNYCMHVRHILPTLVTLVMPSSAQSTL